MDDNSVKRHPLPQHISGYEFRLVGNMTLKQFGELALGVILAMICWSLPIIPFFKYLLICFFGLLGVGLAFLPINEQPLDKWIINFFRSVYSPTQYLWQKAAVTPEFLTKPAAVPRPRPDPPAGGDRPLIEADQEKLEKYLQSVPEPELQPWEKQEKEEMTKIAALLEKKPIVKPVFKPRPTVTPRFEPELPLPSRPTMPNVLVGMILDNQGKILTDAMLEIRDEKGFPVRAFKANKLGQFSIATPLKNGTYELEIEKDGYQFDIIKFHAKGAILDPFKIQAKEKLS